MPSQIIPVTDIASAGVIMDTPSVSLPPNVFSDVSNIRFHNGAAMKMPGEAVFATLVEADYVAYWPGPGSTGDKIVVIAGASLTVRTTDAPNDVIFTINGVTDSDNWQHTLFNGGFHIVLNNGVDTPIFIADTDLSGQVRTIAANAPLIQLPNWNSYLVEDVIQEFEHDGSAGEITITNSALIVGAELKITFIPRSTAAPIVTETVTIAATSVVPDGTLEGIGTISNVAALPLASAGNSFGFTPDTGSGGGVYRMVIVNPDTPIVTADVIRSYGSLLVAGGLREAQDGGRVLPGTIRTSDVAQPGDLPQNWNPFALGVNSADEIILATTGAIVDMAELQGILYVYTDNSIHAIQRSGNPTVPFRTSPVTDNFGCDNTGGVLEVDGKHIVVGNNDVYIFAGHPGSISSIADGRVRDAFRDTTGWQILRFNKWDELWFWRRGVQEIYVWNYRTTTWTTRNQTTPLSMTYDGDEVVAAHSAGILRTDNSYTDVGGNSYSSYLERKRMALAPEFDTETLNSIALMYSGTADLEMLFESTNAPGDEGTIGGSTYSFTGASSWKTDIRIQGRFLNYRIADASNNTSPWSLTGFQLDVGKGGTR